MRRSALGLACALLPAAALRRAPRYRVPPPRIGLAALGDARVTFVATLAERRALRRRPHAPVDVSVLLADVRRDGGSGCGSGSGVTSRSSTPRAGAPLMAPPPPRDPPAPPRG